MKLSSASVLALVAVVGAVQLNELEERQSNNTILNVIEVIVGPAVASELLAQAPTQVIQALNTGVAGLGPLISQLQASIVPTAFVGLPTDVIGVIEEIAGEIAVLPTDVVNFIATAPSQAGPLISAAEAGVSPPASVVQALPSSLVSELIPVFNSVYGTGAVSSYLMQILTPTGSASAMTTMSSGSMSGSMTSASMTTAPSSSVASSASAAGSSSTSNAMAGNVVAGGWMAGIIGTLGMALAL
ncbi:hypothetical protein MMC18_008091 [Xylographa bjoerkii]|nr:hypothetical protein [Xylographa bjoerkii]